MWFGKKRIEFLCPLCRSRTDFNVEHVCPVLMKERAHSAARERAAIYQSTFIERALWITESAKALMLGDVHLNGERLTATTALEQATQLWDSPRTTAPAPLTSD